MVKTKVKFYNYEYNNEFKIVINIFGGLSLCWMVKQFVLWMFIHTFTNKEIEFKKTWLKLVNESVDFYNVRYLKTRLLI